MTEQDARERLKAEVKRHRTAGEAAVAMGISHSFLCDILQGHRGLSPRVLAYLGLERVTTIRHIRRGTQQQTDAA